MSKPKQQASAQLHAGQQMVPGRGGSDDLWHTRTLSDGTVVYWCGSWHERSPLELYLECATTMSDLLRNHPEIVSKLTSLVEPTPPHPC